MSDEGIRNRLMARQNGNSSIVDLLMVLKLQVDFFIRNYFFQKFTDLCQEGEDDEEGVINIYVTEEMSKNDVVDQIVEKTQNYLQK